jgi:hypothetical protein
VVNDDDDDGDDDDDDDDDNDNDNDSRLIDEEMMIIVPSLSSEPMVNFISVSESTCAS